MSDSVELSVDYSGPSHVAEATWFTLFNVAEALREV